MRQAAEVIFMFFLGCALGLLVGFPAGVKQGYRTAMDRVHEAIERAKTKHGPDDAAHE